MDGPSPEPRWAAAWPAEAWGQLVPMSPPSSVWGQRTVAGDRDTRSPDKPPGHECGRSLPARVPSPCRVLEMRYGPEVAFRTNSKETLASVPRT